jgi:hypothetical protein
MVQTEPASAENSGRSAEMRAKWMQTWETVGERVLNLPNWMQIILLEDLNCAVIRRVATMEMIQHAQRKR